MDVFAALTGDWFPLSLALSRKGRGDVLFECIDNVQSGCSHELSGSYVVDP